MRRGMRDMAPGLVRPPCRSRQSWVLSTIRSEQFRRIANDIGAISPTMRRKVLNDLAKRFAVGRICVVADRGLISASNLETVAQAGVDHLLATRLRRDTATTEALSAIDQDTVWVELPQPGSRAADITLGDGTRTVVVESDARVGRDTQRTAQIIKTAETRLLALERRVRKGGVKDPAQIGRAAQHNESSTPGGSPGCSTWRSARAVSSTTTTKQPCL